MSSELATWWWWGGELPRGACQPVGACTDEASQPLMAGLPDEVHVGVTGPASQLPSTTLLLLSKPPPLGHTAHLHALYGARRERPPWQCPAQLGEPGTHPHTLTDPVKKSPAGRSSALSSASLGDGDSGKVELFLSPSSVCPVLDLSLQQCAGTSLLDSWTSTKVLLLVGDCQNWCSLRQRSGSSYSSMLLTTPYILCFVKHIATKI